MGVKDPNTKVVKKPDANEKVDLEAAEKAGKAATKALAEEEAAKAEAAAVAEAKADAEAPEDKELYRLRRSFWNGRAKIPGGECYYFAKGSAPGTARNVKSGKTGAQERAEMAAEAAAKEEKA